MRLGLLALFALLIPAQSLACRAPPHAASDFSRQSYVSLPHCQTEQSEACLKAVTVAAWFEVPTRRYAHGVLGDDVEAGALRAYSHDAAADSCNSKSVLLPQAYVFEDIKPHLVDIDGDARNEIIVVRSHKRKGAQLAIYADMPGEPDLRLVAATPHIGTANRWLAPIGAADLDGDGRMEVAYIDRPHLAKTLRIWRFEDGSLRHVVDKAGLTNHRIGEDWISGGIRHCGGRPEMIVARADWSRVVAVTFDGRSVRARDLGPHDGKPSFARAMSCS